MINIFGIETQELIFSIFLPFLFFYLLIYALLTKSKIFGESANRINSILSLVISALGIFSLYSLGLAYWLPFLAAFLAVAAFASLYFLGVSSYSLKKIQDITENEKKFKDGVKKCEEIWEGLNKTKDPVEQMKLIGKLESEIERLRPLAEKLGKNLEDFEWYRKYKEIEAARQK
ncbi:MAG: hypothetical protein QW472_00945 [Candidatus Aenigmatarchaeota archaeon]